MTLSLKTLDTSSIGDHSKIDVEDNIFYLEDYEAKGTFQGSNGNNIILNLKKSMDRKGTSEWIHKERAIREIADVIADVMNEGAERVEKVYWIPVPPSKNKTDPLFDDRVYRILVLAHGLSGNHKHIVADVFQQTLSRDAFSTKKIARSIEDLTANYVMGDIPKYNPKTDAIVIFDDVLTTGCHFKAIEGMIRDKYDDPDITGIFVARVARKVPD